MSAAAAEAPRRDPDREPRGGGPRDPRTDGAIMAATRRLLTELGYEQVSMESIAKAAGVSRPTIYRRWPSKAHVVFEAAFGTPATPGLVSRTGDFETDLREFVRRTVAFWQQPVVKAATMGILADRQRDPELNIRTQRLLDDMIRGELATLVHSGAEAGVVRAGVDIDTLFNTLVGTAFYSTLVDGRGGSEHLADTLCSLVMRGVQKSRQDEEPR